MAGILKRFTDIMSANINALLDKAEDPEKMIDQYLRELADNLAEVKQETAGVMAEEARTKRLVDENAAAGHSGTDGGAGCLPGGNGRVDGRLRVLRGGYAQGRNQGP